MIFILKFIFSCYLLLLFFTIKLNCKRFTFIKFFIILDMKDSVFSYLIAFYSFLNINVNQFVYYLLLRIVLFILNHLLLIYLD